MGVRICLLIVLRVFIFLRVLLDAQQVATSGGCKKRYMLDIA
eukprot:COSAG01_NODE_48970_length_376_cov_0.927798_2_plen_41_part_01